MYLSFQTTVIQYLLLNFLVTKSASDGKRQALVFGCSEYDEFKTLENPVKDAEAVRDKLTKFGFTVNYTKNPKYKMMEEKLEDFLKSLNDNTSDIVIYFAGHGCNIGKFILIFCSQAGQDICKFLTVSIVRGSELSHSQRRLR